MLARQKQQSPSDDQRSAKQQRVAAAARPQQVIYAIVCAPILARCAVHDGQQQHQ
jgi:hypothetical protein